MPLVHLNGVYPGLSARADARFCCSVGSPLYVQPLLFFNVSRSTPSPGPLPSCQDHSLSVTYNLSFRVSLSCAAEVEVQEYSTG
jgi:hypothetical protein